MSETSKTPSIFMYVRRAVLLVFMTGFIISTVLMLISGGIFARAGAGMHRIALGPLTFFSITKESFDDGGTSAQLSPGFGVLVLVVLLPILAGFMTFLFKRKKHEAAQA